MTDLFALARACGAHVGHSTIGGDPKNRRVHYSFDPDQLAAFAARIDQAPQAAGPVAWMRDAGEDSISTMSFCCTDRVKKIWLKANPRQVERYTIPLYAAPQAPAQPLTNEELAVIESDYGSSQNSMSEAGLMRAVERAVWAKIGIAPSAQGEPKP